MTAPTLPLREDSPRTARVRVVDLATRDDGATRVAGTTTGRPAGSRR